MRKIIFISALLNFSCATAAQPPSPQEPVVAQPAPIVTDAPKTDATTSDRVGGQTEPKTTSKTTTAAESEKRFIVGQMRSVTPADLASLKKLNQSYQTSNLVSMDVAKTLKLGLLDQVRESKGKVQLSKGQMRMELQGSERSLLIVNKKNLWAVTFPPEQFKDAAVQVIRGETGSKKAKTQALTGLLAVGGFLQHFRPTGVSLEPNGESLYFLQPLQESQEFKRAQVKVSKDFKQITQLRYWDEKDNETIFQFSNISFSNKVDQKNFEYTPPANADVMNL